MQSLRLGDARTRRSDGGVARTADATHNTDPRSPPHSDYTFNAPAADRSPWSFSPRRSLYVSGARA